MANREERRDYKSMLGEHFEKAYNLKGGIEPLSDKNFDKWKKLAKIKRKERRKQFQIMASLASVFTMVVCFGAVSLMQLPDAQADEDRIVEMQDSRDDNETMTVDVYGTHENIPDKIKEGFFMFDNLPESCKLSEIKIISIGETYRYEGEFKYKEESSFTIKQKVLLENTSLDTMFVRKDYKENWDGIEVYIKEYLEDDQQIIYSLIVKDIFINIMSDKEVEKDVIKQIIKEAGN